MGSNMQFETAISQRASLTTLPSEILVFTFCQLSSLSDALALAASSKALNHVLEDNGSQIARILAQKTLACPQEALQLLVDQDESSKGPSGTGRHRIKRVLRNREAVDTAILRFEDVIVKHVTCPGFDTQRVYGAKRRPKHLTSRERLRFIRAYYQSRSLLCIGETLWERRLAQITNLRHLYYLHEICVLPRNIAEDIPPDNGAFYGLGAPDPVFERLRSAVWQRMDEISYAAFGNGAEDVEIYGMEDGHLWFVALWDHWQENLKQVICRLKPTELGKQAELDRVDLWISDEE